MASTAPKVLVPIADDTEPIEAIITIDVLRRSGADVTVVSAGQQLRVEAMFGIKIIADAFVSDVADTVFDLIALPATCYPSFMETLASYATAVESTVQLDGRVVTSPAPGTTMEFGLALVEQLYGKHKADEVAGPLVKISLQFY